MKRAVWFGEKHFTRGSSKAIFLFLDSCSPSSVSRPRFDEGGSDAKAEKRTDFRKNETAKIHKPSKFGSSSIDA
jgi:hypothetical protein